MKLLNSIFALSFSLLCGLATSAPGVNTRIEAEDFTNYQDSDQVNQGGSNYRDTPVDIEDMGSASNGRVVGYISAGEWLEWDFDSQNVSGELTLELSIASQGDQCPANVQAVLSLGGSEKTVSLSETGGWTSFQTQQFTWTPNPGNKLRLTAPQGCFNLDWIRLSSSNIVEQAKLEVIPKVQEAVSGEGSFTLSGTINLHSADEILSKSYMVQLLKSLAIDTKITSSDDSDIRFKLNSSYSENKEAYELKISAEGIDIQASGEAGLFYAVQTLRQMLPPQAERQGEDFDGDIKLPYITIKDAPNKSWRGSMIDVARHFFSIEYLKAHIDRMALYKLNRLHLHLSDDQGWRLEIKSWPQLALKGGLSEVNKIHTSPLYYSQKEYSELVQYAADRHIVIVPELDMPGHTTAALASYASLNCDNQAPDLYTGIDVVRPRLCPRDPDVEQFVIDVVKEVAALTPGAWIHIGGDEASGISDADYLYFMKIAEREIKANGKVMIHWESDQQVSGLDALVQNWKTGSSGGDISSQCDYTYIDHAQVWGEQGISWCGDKMVTLSDVYSTQPGRLGAEAPLWTEYTTESENADSRIWPRLAAMAEATWSPSKNFTDFKDRLVTHGQRLDLMGVDFFATELTWERYGSNFNTYSSVFADFNPEPMTGINDRIQSPLVFAFADANRLHLSMPTMGQGILLNIRGQALEKFALDYQSEHQWNQKLAAGNYILSIRTPKGMINHHFKVLP